MPEIIGKFIELGVGVEKVRGTAQLTAEKWFKKITASIVEKSEKKDDESTMNVLSDSLNTRVVKKWIEGDLEGNAHADAIGYLLYNLYGAVASVNVSGSVYTHTFTLANSIEHASLTLFAKDGAVQQLSYDNCMISTLELTAVVDDYVKFTASFMGKASNSNSDTPSYDTEYDFIGKDVTVKFADTEAGLVGATALCAKELSINFDTGLINDFCLGSYTPNDLYNAKMAIEGEFTLNYDDNTFKDLYLADTNKYMEITIQGAADIGGGNNPKIVILLNQVQIKEWTREGGNDELITQPISFKAFYNETDSQQSKITLTNLTTEYSTPISD